jgi:hypothetical protein
MKRIFLSMVATVCLFAFSGCGNLSPRQQNEIDNQNGKIGDIDNLANSLKAEIGKLQNQNDISNSRLDRFQQGLANFQSTNENSGIQILSGPGGLLVGLVGLLGVGVIAMHYRSQAKMHEKTADILAERVVGRFDDQLTDDVFQAVMHTNAEGNMLKLVKKHQLKFAELRKLQAYQRPL